MSSRLTPGGTSFVPGPSFRCSSRSVRGRRTIRRNRSRMSLPRVRRPRRPPLRPTAVHGRFHIILVFLTYFLASIGDRETYVRVTSLYESMLKHDALAVPSIEERLRTSICDHLPCRCVAQPGAPKPRQLANHEGSCLERQRLSKIVPIRYSGYKC